MLGGAAHAIAEIDHERLFDHGVELFIAGLAATYRILPGQG